MQTLQNKFQITGTTVLLYDIDMHFDTGVFSNYQMYILVLCSCCNLEDMNFFNKMNIKFSNTHLHVNRFSVLHGLYNIRQFLYRIYVKV